MTASLVIRERDIQRTCCDILRADGWRILEPEQQWSEKKRKTVGEKGMPDVLAIRYFNCAWESQVLWIEFKRIDKRGRPTKATQAQIDWHAAERARGALIWVAGVDFPASIEGFTKHYRQSGLARRV